MKVKERLGRCIKAGLAAGAIALGSLGYSADAGAEDTFENRIESGFRIGEGSVKNDLNCEKRTVYIHPDDGGKERGGVVMDINELSDGGTVSLYCEGSTGLEWLRLKAGIEGRLNSFSVEDKGLQPLPPPYESYGWAEFSEDSLSWMPYVGAELRWNVTDDFSLYAGANRGWVESGFTYKSGHERYCQVNTDFSEHDRVWGNNYTFYIGISGLRKKDEPHENLYLAYTIEDYKADISGGTNIRKNLAILGISVRF